jgi:hypothetical protein
VNSIIIPTAQAGTECGLRVRSVNG